MSKFAQFLLIMNIFFGLFVNFPSELSCLISALKKKKIQNSRKTNAKWFICIIQAINFYYKIDVVKFINSSCLADWGKTCLNNNMEYFFKAYLYNYKFAHTG